MKIRAQISEAKNSLSIKETGNQNLVLGNDYENGYASSPTNLENPNCQQENEKESRYSCSHRHHRYHRET